MLEMVADRDVWRLNLDCCPRKHHGYERALKEDFLVHFLKYVSNKLQNQAKYFIMLALLHRSKYYS